MEHWYIYYDCPRDSAHKTIERARVMQQTLGAQNGKAGRLLQRIDGQDRMTLMEIYEHIDEPERFASELDDALAHSGLAIELRNARHVERFKDT